MASAGRLRYLDLLRGWSVLFMFEAHAYHAWCSPEAKQTAYYINSRYFAGLAAPLFLFLAGMSFVLMENSYRRKGISAAAIRDRLLRRGLWIFVAAFLFRMQSFVLQGRGAKALGILRVDILNCIGLSLLAISAVLIIVRERYRLPVLVLLALSVALFAPPLYDVDLQGDVPWIIAQYINGRAPASLFPIFPWFAFAFAGAAAGVPLLASRRDVATESRFVWVATGVSVAAIGIGLFMQWVPYQFYRHQEFWLTSPQWVLIRLGAIGILMGACYLWRRWRREPRFSVIEQLGKHSLLMYWVHVELVYGGLSKPIKGQLGVITATAFLLLLTGAMLALSFLPDRLKSWRERWGRRAVSQPA